MTLRPPHDRATRPGNPRPVPRGSSALRLLALVGAGQMVVCGVRGPPLPPLTPAQENAEADGGSARGQASGAAADGGVSRPACCAADGGSAH
jgi:hypothetical protein